MDLRRDWIVSALPIVSSTLRLQARHSLLQAQKDLFRQILKHLSVQKCIDLRSGLNSSCNTMSFTYILSLFICIMNFGYLRVPQQLLSKLIVSPQDIRYSFTEGSQIVHKRRLFTGLPMEPFEARSVEQMEQQIRQMGYQPQSKSITLRFVYAGKFKMRDSLEKYKLRLAWLNNLRITSPTQVGFILLKTGFVYAFGRDVRLRPVIIANVKKLRLGDYSLQNYANALHIFFSTVIEWMFVEGKIEQWVIIIDVDNAGVSQIDYIGGKNLFMNMAAAWPAHLFKLFILKPNFIVRSIVGLVLKIMDEDTRRKVQLIPNQSFARLRQQIPADQLQLKFGGQLQDQAEFWPISKRFCQVAQRPALDSQQVELSFYSVQNNLQLEMAELKEEQFESIKQVPVGQIPVSQHQISNSAKQNDTCLCRVF